MPYVFRWTGTIPSGSVSTQPIASIDLYPSTLELAGAKKPDNHVLDGVSYVSHLKDPANTKVGRDALFWHFPGYLGAGNNTWRTKPVSVVRSGPWKLIQSIEDQSLQLYNLDEDLGEKNNLASSQAEKARELLAKLDAWRAEIKAPLPTKNEPQDSPAGTGKTRKKRSKK